MTRFATILGVVLFCLPLVGAGEAQAYDAENTHRWIARQSVELLVASFPGEYDELLEYTEEVVSGAHHEDDFYLDGDDNPETLRVMRHFYHAQNNSGLTYFGETFPNAFEWNAVENDQNEWDYHDGLLAYQHGDFGQAYFIAGHTLHLIADLTVPAHTHLDDHGPPTGDNYEDHCTRRMKSQYEGSLRSPKPGSIMPVFLDLKDAFQKTAEASYFRNLYPGDFSGEEPTGIVFDMFPEVSKGWISGNWEIKNIGEEGVAFYTESPGMYYFSKNEAAPKYDILGYDASRPHERTYGPIDSDIHMVQRMADDLVPVAILHSASVLKMFIDQARTLPRQYKDSDLAPPQSGTCSAGSSSTGAFLLLALCVFYRRRLSLKGHNV